MGFIWNKDRETPKDPDVAMQEIVIQITENDLVMLLWFAIFLSIGFGAGYFACTKKSFKSRRRR